MDLPVGQAGECSSCVSRHFNHNSSSVSCWINVKVIAMFWHVQSLLTHGFHQVQLLVTLCACRMQVALIIKDMVWAFLELTAAGDICWHYDVHNVPNIIGTHVIMKHPNLVLQVLNLSQELMGESNSWQDWPWDFANCNATWNLFNLVKATISTIFSPYLYLILPIPSQNHLLLLDRQPRPEMHCCSWTKPIRKIFLWNSLIRKHLGIGFGFQSGVLCEAWMALRSLEKFIYVQFAST